MADFQNTHTHTHTYIVYNLRKFWRQFGYVETQKKKKKKSE